MYFKKLIFSTFLSLLTLTHAQSSIGLNINNDDVEVVSSFNLNSFASYSDGTDYLLDINYLHTDGDNMTSVAILGQNTLQGVEALTLAFGVKTVLTDDFLAIPFTFQSAYTMPFTDNIPTTRLLLSFSYAPSALSFSNAKNYSDVKFEADMEIIHNIHLFTGYRNIKTNYESEDKTFNSSLYGGIKLTF